MPIAIPTRSEELEEMLGDSARIQTLLGDRAAFKEFIQSYARAQAQTDQDSIRRQVAEALDGELKTQGVRHALSADDQPQRSPLARRQAPSQPSALGTQLDGRFEGIGDFARAIDWRNIRLNGVDPRLRVTNDLSGVIGPDGGFLVPEVLRSTLFALALESGLVRPRATVIPMDSLTVPFPVVDDTSHASSVYGGFIGYWTAESAQLTESQPTFGRVLLEAKKLTLYTEVPNELIADSILSLEAFLNEKMPGAISFFEDLAFLRGGGAGEPVGILNADALISVAKETGQAATTIVWENLVKIYARLLPASHGADTCWFANINTFPQLALMSLNVGTGGSAIWLNNGQVGPPMTILGHPVLFTEKLPTLGTVGDIMLCDCSYYLIGDRQVMTMRTSEHFKFQNDQTVYRAIERVDGRPWIQSALTPRAGSTLSPFVALATRA